MKNRRIVITLVGIVLFAGYAAVAPPVMAGDTYWQHDPAGPGDWSTSSNWTVGEPTAPDVAYINNGGTAQITETGEVGDYLYLGYDSADSGTLNITSGSLNISTDGYIGYKGNGTIDQSGGTLSVTSYLRLGYEYFSTASGTYNHSGGILNCGSLRLAEYRETSGTYNLSGSGIINTGRTDVGVDGVGNFYHTGGTNMVSDELSIGTGYFSEGTYTISGAQSQLSTNKMIIGGNGRGKFIQNGGTVNVGTVISFATNGSGYGHGIYKLNDGVLSVGEYEIVGQSQGIGTFKQSGGTNTVPNLIVAYKSTNPSKICQGTYELSGGELSTNLLEVGFSADTLGRFIQTDGTNTISNELLVGGAYYSNGEYDQSGGTTIIGGALRIGGKVTTATGAATLSGGMLTVPDLYVGEKGSGSLNISSPAADITVSNKLAFGAYSTFTAAPGAVIHMTGSAFENENTDPADLAGLSSLELIFEGGAEDIDPFEVAAAVGGGFGDNFALGALTVGSVDTGKVQLVDAFDNGNRDVGGSECLFAYEVIINEGSQLDLNSLLLYVEGDVESTLDGWIADGRLFDSLLGSTVLDAVYVTEDDWTMVIPDPVTFVDLDIKPGSDRNPVNLKSKGKLPVVLFGNEELDVSMIDLGTLLLNGVGLTEKNNGDLFASLEDEDGDGILDLVMHFGMQDLGIEAGMDELLFSGSFLDGGAFEGSDIISIVGGGDANGDGVVSADDYASIQANFGSANDTGIFGDADGDGVISANDYASVQSNFGATTGMGSVSVPEPATLSLLVIGGLAMLKGRRK